MANLVFMDELLKTFNKEKIEQLLKIGEVKLDKEGVPYLVIDMDVYLEANINLNANEEVH
jgi:hypothetical protein